MDDNEVYQTVRAGETEKGKKKHMEIIIIIAVVILAVAIAAAVFVIKGKNKTQEQPSVAQTTTEKAGDETTQEPDIITPVSASDDIDITFEHVTREFMEDFEAHQETTSAMIATELDCIVNQYTDKFLNPMVMWGKYRKSWFKKTLPISFQFHHVAGAEY